MEETLPHNMTTTTTTITYMHESINESSTSVISLLYTHLILTYFSKKCNFLYMQLLTNVGRWGEWSHAVGGWLSLSHNSNM